MPNHRAIRSILPLATLLSFATWAAWSVSAEPDSKTKSDADHYIRVHHDENGKPIALETAVVRFVPKGNEHPGLQVDLVAAVHIADKSYYDELNKRFDKYDVVLYELVAPEGTQVPKGGGAKNRNVLSAMQNGLKDLLELEYQLAGIDYTKKNFVHADMSPDEFAKSMEQKGESFWSIVMKMMAAGMAQQSANPGQMDELDIITALFDKDRALKLKRILADEFADMDTFMTAFNGPDGSTLITERNKAALKVLKEQIDGGKKKIAIFYGGGHMPDMQERLEKDFNLNRDHAEWLQAWNMRDAK